MALWNAVWTESGICIISKYSIEIIFIVILMLVNPPERFHIEYVGSSSTN
jgi:hypothetical protein